MNKQDFDDESAALANQQEQEQQKRLSVSFFERVAEIQRKLNAPKGQFNKFGGYKYRSCEDILEAVKPLLDGLIIIINDDIAMIGDRIYVKATACITDGKQKVEASAYAREPQEKKGMDQSQITGAASSYARKYALNGLLLIDDSKDHDTEELKAEAENREREERKQSTTRQRKDSRTPEELYQSAMTGIAKSDGSNIEAIREYAKKTFANDEVKISAINKACDDRLDELLTEVA